jgi:hypothetical protein
VRQIAQKLIVAELRRALIAPEGPEMVRQQSQKNDAHEDEQKQREAAQPLMASETGLGGFDPAALLIWLGRGRGHDTITL